MTFKLVLDFTPNLSLLLKLQLFRYLCGKLMADICAKLMAALYVSKLSKNCLWGFLLRPFFREASPLCPTRAVLLDHAGKLPFPKFLNLPSSKLVPSKLFWIRP